jgi:hypothetical protein
MEEQIEMGLTDAWFDLSIGLDNDIEKNISNDEAMDRIECVTQNPVLSRIV